MWKHQSALCAKNGVIGRAAVAAAEAVGEGKEFDDVVANVVRILEYLVPDYYEDFKISTANWVRLNVDVGQPQADLPATGGPPAVHQPLSQSYAACMQLVYTKHVIPEELLELWHNSSNGNFYLHKTWRVRIRLQRQPQSQHRQPQAHQRQSQASH